MAIKVNISSPTQTLVKPQDRNLEVTPGSVNAKQRFTGHRQPMDSLTLTESAFALNRLFQSAVTASTIDITRTREIKRIIDEGNHIIDSAHVAQKLIQFENAL